MTLKCISQPLKAVLPFALRVLSKSVASSFEMLESWAIYLLPLKYPSSFVIPTGDRNSHTSESNFRKKPTSSAVDICPSHKKKKKNTQSLSHGILRTQLTLRFLENSQSSRPWSTAYSELGRGGHQVLGLGVIVCLSAERDTPGCLLRLACLPGGHLESQPPQGTCLLQGAVWHAFSSSP